MPEVLVHIVIPLFVMVMLGIELKRALPLSLLAVLPDFDVIFRIHRSMSHSCLFVFLISLPLIGITSIKNCL